MPKPKGKRLTAEQRGVIKGLKMAERIMDLIVGRVYEEARAEGAELEREACARWWDDTEVRSAEAHAAYQREAHRRGDVRHPDAYDDLSELTKEWDRVLVRWVAAAIRARGQGGEEKR